MTNTRRHDIDALRVLAFSLLILYHVGMFYVADWGWHIKSAYQSEWLQIPMLLSNQWRMALIFLLSGLSLSFVFHRYAGLRLAGRRLWRLGLPLLFGMMVVCAPQAYIEARSGGVIDAGFGSFFPQYLTMQAFPAEAWGGAEMITWTWTHLWYLPYLLAYTLVLIPLAHMFARPGSWLVRAFAGLQGAKLVFLPILPLIAYGIFIYPFFPYMNHGLLDDWYAHAMFFTFFAYGFLIGNSQTIWQSLVTMRKATLPGALFSFVILYVVSNVMPDGSFIGQGTAELLVVYLNRWLWIIAVLGWGHHLLNRPFKWLPYATEAVFPWYILHQTLTIVAGYSLSRMQLGPVIEPVLVLLATVGGCLLIHEFMIRRVGFLRPLFGLKVTGSHRSQGIAQAWRRALPAANAN